MAQNFIDLCDFVDSDHSHGALLLLLLAYPHLSLIPAHTLGRLMTGGAGLTLFCSWRPRRPAVYNNFSIFTHIRQYLTSPFQPASHHRHCSLAAWLFRSCFIHGAFFIPLLSCCGHLKCSYCAYHTRLEGNWLSFNTQKYPFEHCSDDDSEHRMSDYFCLVISQLSSLFASELEKSLRIGVFVCWLFGVF